MIPLRRPPAAVGAAVALAAVALVTLLLYGLREIAPVRSLGAVYLLAVLGVAVASGRGLAIATAVLAALAFDFFHLPPRGSLSLRDGDDWVGLAILVIAATVVGTLAQSVQERSQEADERRREADLAAELARVLLTARDIDAALPLAAQRIAAALGLESAALSAAAHDPQPRRRALAITGAPRPPAAVRRAAAAEGAAATPTDGAEAMAWLVVPASTPDGVIERLERAVLPTLAALLDTARARQRLLGEVVETRALRRSEDLKTTLLRTVSHDLRTPLTGIAASAEALASASLSDEERRELAAGAAEEANKLAALVDDLLDLSRLEAGRADPRRQWLALDEVLDVAEDGLDRSRIDVRLEGELPMLHADPAQLGRAFHNLLENALRHSGTDRVTVRVASVGARLVVRVTDRGPGIAAAEHERVFEPFYGNGGFAGSGLGLAIVRGFVQANGGTVELESYPGQGATFVVKLPLVEGAR